MAAPGPTPAHERNIFGLAPTDRAAAGEADAHRQPTPKAPQSPILSDPPGKKFDDWCSMHAPSTTDYEDSESTPTDTARTRNPIANLPGQNIEEYIFRGPLEAWRAVARVWQMDTLGIEPRASRMLSGCDTTTPCAH